MMRLPPFKYVAPTSLDQAVRLLADAGPEAALVAGGTDLLPNMKRRQVSPTTLVGLRALRGLSGIRQEEDRLVIGAGTTLTELATHPLIRKHYRPIAEAALEISTPLLRNMGTVGGNLCLDTRCHFLNQSQFWRTAIGSCMKAEGEICLVAPGGHRCWAITSADLPPLLIALKARVHLLSPRGERDIPLQEFYRPDGMDYLSRAPDEILTEVQIPALQGKRAGYLKMRRREAFDFPSLGVAAALQLDESGTCRAASIVLGAVAPQPVLVPEAELLVGKTPGKEVFQILSEEIKKKNKPMHLADYTHSYRRQMIGVYVNRLLEQLVEAPQ